ncbi:hypothetical protein [Microvirga massiliensis]|uniref:hypothetical protein n=1 Tax=Microvirga massiliensis TaxID=1033741 RepID=UPI00062B33A8|nr:hypothetical protein [Microvirga massiliensis]
MGYTRESLELAVKRIVDSLGGVRHLFSHHRLHRDGQDLETFEAEWPALPLESRVGKLACLIGPSRIGDCGLLTRAYLDLCRKNAPRFETGLDGHSRRLVIIGDATHYRLDEFDIAEDVTR